MLTLEEAWDELAVMWDSPKKTVGGRVYIENSLNLFDIHECGICDTIRLLHQQNKITQTTRAQLEDATPPASRENLNYPYKWPRTLEGAKQRAAFCREQAKKVRSGHQQLLLQKRKELVDWRLKQFHFTINWKDQFENLLGTVNQFLESGVRDDQIVSQAVFGVLKTKVEAANFLLEEEGGGEPI